MKTEKIKELYEKIFDETGKIKLCGRASCIQLMNELQTRFPNVDFGNTESGMMEVETVKSYVKQLLS